MLYTELRKTGKPCHFFFQMSWFLELKISKSKHKMRWKSNLFFKFKFLQISLVSYYIFSTRSHEMYLIKKKSVICILTILLSITIATWANILNYLVGRNYSKNSESNIPIIEYGIKVS